MTRLTPKLHSVMTLVSPNGTYCKIRAINDLI